MSTPVRTVVTFQSTRFNTSKPLEPPKPPDDFGDDVCEWMMGKLAQAGIPVRGPYVEGPCDLLKDNRGVWSISFTLGKQEYGVFCGLRSPVKDEPATWVAEVHRYPPSDWIYQFLWSIGRDMLNRVDLSATRTIHGVLSEEPAISNIRWYRRADFCSGIEDAASTPS